MEFTCAVWYEGILTHYHVLETGANAFSIRLLNTITKTARSLPPRKISVWKKGGEWISDQTNPEFLKDLVSTITANKSVDALLADK